MLWLRAQILCLLAIVAFQICQAAFPSSLTLIAEFVTVDYLWDANHTRSAYEEDGQFVVCNNIVTGVKVSQVGQIFVSVPRWLPGVPSSLNMLVSNPNGPGFVLQPWPSWEFNEVGKAGSLQYSQSFTIDSKYRMWIAEVGRIDIFVDGTTTSGPAGIIVVDIATGNVENTYYFPNEVVSYNNSFVNDIVLDEVNGYAYLSDTWGNGGIIVYNINKNTSQSWSGPSTQRNASYNFCVNGICYGTDGVGSSPSDGIALSDDGSTLYWSPVQGQGLYSILTKYLWNFSMTNAQFQQNVVFLGLKTGCSDGLLFMNGNLYYGNIQQSELGVVNNMATYNTANSLTLGDSTTSASNPSDLNWIDTFSIDFNNPNALYFTSNKLNLYFANTMDFTGQSGANFRIYHAVVTTTTSTSSTSSSNSSNSLTNGDIAAIVGSLSIAAFFAIVAIYRKYYMKEVSAPSANLLPK